MVPGPPSTGFAFSIQPHDEDAVLLVSLITAQEKAYSLQTVPYTRFLTWLPLRTI